MAARETTAERTVRIVVDLVTNKSRWEIAFYLGQITHQVPGYDPASSAVFAFIDTGLAALQNCVSSQTEIRKISGHPLLKGGLPFVFPFSAGARAGTRPAPAGPEQVGGLITCYGSNEDFPQLKKTSEAHTFIGGLAKADMGPNVVLGVLSSRLTILANLFAIGFHSSDPLVGSWVRVIHTDKTPGSKQQLCISSNVTNDFCTQRRRLLPR